MLNKVILMGRNVKDPELRSLANGTAVCRFTIAVERSFVKQGEERQSDFITVVAWGKTAELVSNYFSKGKMIAVCGRIETRSYEDNDGKRHYVTEVVAEEVHFCGNKNDSGQQQQPSTNIDGFTPVESEDELPF